MTIYGEVSVEPRAELKQCFDRFLFCVTECCGIDAFEVDAEFVAEWARSISVERLGTVEAQLEDLNAAVTDRAPVVSTYLNHAACDDDSRKRLLDLLSIFRLGFAEGRS